MRAGSTGTGSTVRAEVPRETLVRHGKRIGVLMDKQAGKLLLRPQGGGVEWEADPDDVEPLTEELE